MHLKNSVREFHGFVRLCLLYAVSKDLLELQESCYSRSEDVIQGKITSFQSGGLGVCCIHILQKRECMKANGFFHDIYIF